jgi:hypothetical protein
LDPYPQANALIRNAEEKLNRPKAPRMKCLLAYADPDSGKTMLEKHYCRLHPIDANPRKDAIYAPVVGIELRSRMKASLRRNLVGSSRTLQGA